MEPEFARIDVSSWIVHEEEPLGKSEKLWIRNPDVEDRPDNRWLFKPVTTHKNGEVQGGDWAEKITSHVADGLGVPSAEIEMASRDGETGTLSRNVRPSDEWDRHTGSLWMDSIQSIDFKASGAHRSKRNSLATSGYTIDAIQTSLRDVGPPPQCDEPLASMSAFDVFAGFLLLDALVANQDRHEQNWSVLRARSAGTDVRLAAAYDHEGALGFQLTDEYRVRAIAAGSVESWAERGAAWRFEHMGNGPVPTLVDFAVNAVASTTSAAREHWVLQVGQMGASDLQEIVLRIPEMSDAKRNFIMKVLEINLGRVQHGLRNIAA